MIPCTQMRVGSWQSTMIPPYYRWADRDWSNCGAQACNHSARARGAQGYSLPAGRTRIIPTVLLFVLFHGAVLQLRGTENQPCYKTAPRNQH